MELLLHRCNHNLPWAELFLQFRLGSEIFENEAMGKGEGDIKDDVRPWEGNLCFEERTTMEMVMIDIDRLSE